MLEGVAVFADLGDQIALVGLLQAAGHLFSPAETAAVVALRVVQRSLEGMGIHRADHGLRQLYGSRLTGCQSRRTELPLARIRRPHHP